MFRQVIAILAVLAISAGTLFAQTTKTAVINMGNVIENFSKTPAALESLKADLALIQEQEKNAVAELNKKSEELQKKVKEIENPLNSPALQKKARDEANELNKTILKERQELSAALEQMKRSLEQKRTEKLNEILKEIAPVIEKYAQENGIEIVINVANGPVVYAAKGTDITQAVNERLAKLFPPAGTQKAADPAKK